VLKCGPEYGINPARLAPSELEMILGPGRVKFAGPGAVNGRNGNGK
jgi:hypothetical protein